MSDHEEEPCSSNSKPRHSLQSERRRRSKPKDPSTELNDVEKKELLRKYAETDQNLEKFAQAHNMTAINVKSILRSVIKNHRALARVLGTDAPDDTIDGVRITRSKTRALQDSSNNLVDMTSNIPIKRGNTWVDLRFNDDDEYDNDYRPDEDDSENEPGSGSSVLGSSDEDESEHLSEFDRDEEDDEEEDDEQNETLIDNSEDDWMKNGGPSLRTRPQSAASITLNAMSVGEDDEPSIDYKMFVNNLNHDDIPYDDDDNEEDPEYMAPTDTIFRDERDDLMFDYWSSTIPLKEIGDLIEDIVPTERFEELANNLDPPMRQMDRPGTSMEERGISPTRNAVQIEEVERLERERAGVFTHHHRVQLQSQLEQHVQLLTQSFVGCYFEPLLQEEKEKAREMINDLFDIASTTWHLGAKSSFHIANLSYAVDTCNRMENEKLKAPIRPLAKEFLTISHSILSITKEVLSSSQAILYPHLVSQNRLVQSIGSSGWSDSEIIYFAMVLNRYIEEPEKHRLPKQSKYSILAENCLPWRTMNELRWQYNGLKRGLSRNGRTRYNTQFFDVAEGNTKLTFPRYLRAKLGWTMEKWPKNSLPCWFNTKMKRMRVELRTSDEENSESDFRRKKERRIDEGSDEIEAIVIVDSDNDEERRDMDNEGSEREDELVMDVDEDEDGDGEEKEDDSDQEEENSGKRKEKQKMNKMLSLDYDECAMDSMEKIGTEKLADEIESARGDEGQFIDFSHLLNEMSPNRTPHLPYRHETPSPPRRLGSPTPDDKTIFPPTPGKRIPSPEESMPWLDMSILRNGFDSPPPHSSSPSQSRIKTPGRTMDYVDSLFGYFGTPEGDEKGKEEEGASPSKRRKAYSNLFGDFDFDESDKEEEMTGVIDDKNIEMGEEVEEDAEDTVTTIDDQQDNQELQRPEETGVRQKKKRPTRLEKERIGWAAITDTVFRRRVMAALARKAADDIKGRMIMHSSIFKQMQSILSHKKNEGEREKMLSNLVPLLSSHHKEVLYLLSAFCPLSSLPRSLVLSEGRLAYVAAIDMMCIIYVYMTKIQKKLSFRQTLRLITDSYKKGGTEETLKVLKEVFVNDPLLIRVLSKYYTPNIPSKKSKGWEVIDLRKGEEAFNIFLENARMERIDLCEVMGGVQTKKMIAKEGKTLSSLLLNHEGEPLLRNEDGKYKEISVMSEKQLEEERKKKIEEKEEEKRAKQREKARERTKMIKKAKMMEKREERAREKKKAIERKLEEEERKKEERQAPPTHPFTRDIDRALLILYNQVQKVTKRAVRKMALDIPYSTNFTIDQLQTRLDFLLSMAKEDHSITQQL